MIVKDAKAVARRWVIDEAARAPGFRGAFFNGSANWLSDDAALPANSDLDLIVVVSELNAAVRSGKVLSAGVILDVSHLPSDQLRFPEQVLGLSHLAGSFRVPSIVSDPSGELTALQVAVSKDYAKSRWVYRRCEHARDKVLRNLQSLNEAQPFPDQVTAWLFGTGVTAHVLLSAGLRNPTVRRRYVVVRELLAEYGQMDFYEPLLELLGCAQMRRAGVEHHLATLTAAFDAAKAVVKTPVFFASDISDLARPIAIDGSRDLIARGDHREAVFWIVATYSRCQKVLSDDAPVELHDRFTCGYRQLLGELGITSFADLQRRGEQVKGFLPRVWDVTEAIIAANGEIQE